MFRAILISLCVALAAVLTLQYFNRSGQVYNQALLQPFKTLIGTSQTINARILEVSESPEAIRAAGRRLLQPFGSVRLLHVYEAPEPEPTPQEKRLPQR